MSLLFVINVFRDGHLVPRLTEQLTRHYPNAGILVIPDEPRLKHRPTGEWSHRFLERALDQRDFEGNQPDTVVKVDPDSCVWRSTRVPRADYFGAVNAIEGYVYGGVCGFSQKAAKALLSSKLLLREMPYYYQSARDEDLMPSQDRAVGEAMRRLKITPYHWDEALSMPPGQHAKARARAFTHPHPFLIGCGA